MKITNIQNHSIHWKNDSGVVSPSAIIILLHGASGGPKNSLIEYLSNNLYQKIPELMIITYTFGFFKNTTKPSSDLSTEAEEIKSVYDWAHHSYPETPVFLVGKSIGGIASLVFDKKYPSKAKKVIVLGWPMKIGFPINLDLLSNDQLSVPDYLTQYRKLLMSISAKAVFIQGDKDDLCDISDCESLAAEANIQILIIPGANHSFMSLVSSEGKNYFSECIDALTKLIIE